MGFSCFLYSDLAAYLTVIDPLKTVLEDDNKENNYMVTIKHVYSYVLKVIQKVTALVFKDGCYKFMGCIEFLTTRNCALAEQLVLTF